MAKRLFNRDVQLRWLGPQLTRRVKRHDAVPLSFADGYPLSAGEQASCAICKALPASVNRTVSPLICIGHRRGGWDEDGWKVIRVGEVVFDVAKPCSRCIFDNRRSGRGQKHPSGEPLENLLKPSAPRWIMAMSTLVRTWCP